jgi:hypothetical protein
MPESYNKFSLKVLSSIWIIYNSIQWNLTAIKMAVALMDRRSEHVEVCEWVKDTFQVPKKLGALGSNWKMQNDHNKYTKVSMAS